MKNIGYTNDGPPDSPEAYEVGIDDMLDKTNFEDFLQDYEFTPGSDLDLYFELSDSICTAGLEFQEFMRNPEHKHYTAADWLAQLDWDNRRLTSSLRLVVACMEGTELFEAYEAFIQEREDSKERDDERAEYEYNYSLHHGEQ